MRTETLTNRAHESSPLYPGWRVVLASFIGVMVSFAAVVPYTFSLFLGPLHTAFGWHRESISAAFSLAAITVALVSPGLGMMLDRVPARRVILPCIGVFALALASLSLLTPHIWQYYGTYFVLGVVGNGTAQLAYSRAILSWFHQRRGLALAITLTGSGTGSIVVPLITQAVITHYGWRQAYLALGLLALLGLPLTATLLKSRTSPRGSTKPEADTFAAGVSLHAALHGRIFWILAVVIALSAFGANGLISHLAALLGERGVSSQAAAATLSILGATGIAGRLGTGLLLDRFFAPYVSAIMLVVSAVGMSMLAVATTAHTGFAGAALLGVGLGSESDVVPYLISRYFGRRHFSALYGLTWTAYAIGGATGPLVIGRLYDRLGGYQPRFVLALALTALAGAALSLLLPRYPLELEAAPLPTLLSPELTVEY